MNDRAHTSVLLLEVLEAFEPVHPKTLLEGTFGRGGHTRALFEKYQGLKVYAFDKDPEALESAKKNFPSQMETGSLVLYHDDFKNFEHYELPGLDGVFVDLGVSSPQFDSPERGFSFMHDGPLDMRMNPAQRLSAASIIAEYSEQDLVELFKTYGEVHKPFRVVRALVHDRKTRAFDSTKQLAQLIERVEGWKKKGVHPATNYFMALRIVVNEELTGLEDFLVSAVAKLNQGGRCVVISFHSLEDRIVKTTFRNLHNPCICPPQIPICQCGRKSQGSVITRKVVTPTDEEISDNPRSRSAKMRIFEKHSESAKG